MSFNFFFSYFLFLKIVSVKWQTVTTLECLLVDHEVKNTSLLICFEKILKYLRVSVRLSNRQYFSQEKKKNTGT